MLADNIVNRVQKILGFRGDLIPDIKQAIRDSQEEAENGAMGFLPWFLRKTATFSISEGDVSVTLPSDFIREYDHDHVSTWVDGFGALMRVPHLFSSGTGDDRTVGGIPLSSSPTGVFFEIDMDAGENVLTLSTAFSTDVVLNLVYYYRDSVLEDEVVGFENNWCKYASEYITGSTGNKLASGLMDKLAVETFLLMTQNGMESVLKQDTAYRMGTFKPQMGAINDRAYDFLNADVRVAPDLDR